MADADRRMMSGTQALVELPLLQRRLDRAAGRNTAGFVTGYRGSPLGGYDQALVEARDRLDPANIRFQPGLNEDLAATAIWGTQQVGMFPGATVDGVFGIWYGKGPGVDRSIDVLKHGNAAGTSPLGGVLLLAGDDHGCVSSTLPHQSGPVLAAASIPVLAPSSIAEMIEFGLLGIAMSRESGCWIALTAASEIVETSAMLEADWLPSIAPGLRGDVGIRWPDPPMEQERRLYENKLPAAMAVASANRIDRIAVDHPSPALTIVTTGKAHGDVMAALAMLGEPPVRVVKVGLAWPLGSWNADWVADAREVLVIEEKRGFVEDQLAALLVNRATRPRLLGKRDGDGLPLLPAFGELGAVSVARVIAARLEALTGQSFVTPHAAVLLPADAALPARAPFFCAGCPHNTSTVVPDGSRAMGGIGCHGMATWMPDRNVQLWSQMGGEGATWIGQSPFTTEQHVFQNMGDGTYNHSGLLAIRAAVAAGVNITYKILYNDAVAMTGGQPHEGALTVEAIAAQLVAEGVRRVVVVSEQPERFTRGSLPAGVMLHPRNRLDAVQRELREIVGVTGLIYDQTCAAELRRRRRTEPALRRRRHIVINPEVCEGCGDCSIQSNCIAIQPVETVLGRKRRIDPASCNQDYSCLEGFCPSFVTIETDAGAEAVGAVRPPSSPDPVISTRSADIVIAGIGGTGVVTIGSILAAAAQHDGIACTVLDVTGLSQKNGAVMSQVRLGEQAGSSSRIAEGGATVMLACDLIAATAPGALSRCGRNSFVIGNGDVAPTAAFIRDGAADSGREAATVRLAGVTGTRPKLVPATVFAQEHTGSALGANILLLGHAWQSGLIPLSLDAMAVAIATVAGGDRNRAAFDWGRAIAAYPALIPADATAPDTLDAIVADRAARLARYQDKALAEHYRRRVAQIAAAEQATGDGDQLARGYARALYRLTAIKDEYEVARLHLDTAFNDDIARRFGASARRIYHLAPPIMGSRKRAFGGWMKAFFRPLAAARRVRGTALDPFRWTQERRRDTAILRDFEARMDGLVSSPTASRAQGLALVTAAESIRGYGHVRAASIELYAAVLADLDGAR